jgi:hypothetical protein
MTDTTRSEFPGMEKSYDAMTIQELGEFLFHTRNNLREIEEERKAEQAIYDTIEYHMIQKMEAAGLSNAGIKECTFSLKHEMYPQVKDIDAFVKWAADNGKAEMLQRRVSAAVFKEYFEATNEMPDGIDTYDKITLGMRKR